jgi:hypothetical protein
MRSSICAHTYLYRRDGFALIHAVHRLRVVGAVHENAPSMELLAGRVRMMGALKLPPHTLDAGRQHLCSVQKCGERVKAMIGATSLLMASPHKPPAHASNSVGQILRDISKVSWKVRVEQEEQTCFTENSSHR